MSIREQISKILFKNKPDKTTPVSAGILNQLQYNIEKALKVKLDYCNTIITNANDVTDAGIYQIRSDATNLPFDPTATQHDSNVCWLIVFLVDNIDPIIQIALDSKTFHIWIRKSKPYEAGWNDWKLLNPDKIVREIVEGEEKSIGIFIDGKEVFVKRINGGKLPNATTKMIDVGIENITPYKIEGMSYSDIGDRTPIPYANPKSAIYAYYLKSSSSISVGTVSDRSNQDFYIDVYYTHN
ncbi:MAG: pyocin knob domain-containing protein [Clostridia bacterium]